MAISDTAGHSPQKGGRKKKGTQTPNPRGGLHPKWPRCSLRRDRSSPMVSSRRQCPRSPVTEDSKRCARCWVSKGNSGLRSGDVLPFPFEAVLGLRRLGLN